MIWKRIFCGRGKSVASFGIEPGSSFCSTVNSTRPWVRMRARITSSSVGTQSFCVNLLQILEHEIDHKAHDRRTFPHAAYSTDTSRAAKTRHVARTSSE